MGSGKDGEDEEDESSEEEEGMTRKAPNQLLIEVTMHVTGVCRCVYICTGACLFTLLCACV